MSDIHEIEHPLIAAKLTRIRDERTPSEDIRALLRQITVLMAFEATKSLPTTLIPVRTSIAQGEFRTLACGPITLVPILRAGMGMLDGMLEVLPDARVGYIGMRRDEESLQPVEYLCKLPSDIGAAPVIVLDPMLATGGSAADAVSMLKAHGAHDIRMMNLVAAPEGIRAFQDAHPDVDIFVAAIDDGLNERAYIVPGIGDAGDRLFGTDA